MIAAIPTKYNGYSFRSRLEARWAVFFDALNVRFEYEKEGYDLGALGWYLPDFWLPDIGSGVWAEVKPEEGLHATAHQKLSALSRITQQNSIMLVGTPWNNLNPQEGRWADDAWMTFPGSDLDPCGMDGPYAFCVCPWCLKVGLTFNGRGARVCGWKSHYPDLDSAREAMPLSFGTHEDKGYSYAHPVIVAAAKAARAASF